MSLVRFLPAWLHAIADYAVALSLITVALVVGGSGHAVATGVVIGAVVLVVSMLTRYPLGVVKVLPFTLHSAGDYLAVVLLAAAPFALDFSTRDRGLTIFYLAAGAAVLLVSLVTNYQYGPKARAATSRAADRGDTNWGTATPTRTRLAAPSYAAQGEGDESWRSVAVADTAPRAARAPITGARSLREILAERAASGESAA